MNLISVFDNLNKIILLISMVLLVIPAGKHTALLHIASIFFDQFWEAPNNYFRVVKTNYKSCILHQFRKTLRRKINYKLRVDIIGSRPMTCLSYHATHAYLRCNFSPSNLSCIHKFYSRCKHHRLNKEENRYLKVRHCDVISICSFRCNFLTQ